MPPHKKVNHYLIGHEINSFDTSVLPSNRQVLNLFCHVHLTEQKSILESAIIVAQNVIENYKIANLPFISSSNVTRKISSLYKQWGNLKKRKTRVTKTPTPKMTIFTNLLDKIFDVTPKKGLNIAEQKYIQHVLNNYGRVRSCSKKYSSVKG